MPGITGVFQFPYPVRGDSARIIPSQIQALAEKVDAALAQRAVAPDVGTAAALATRATNLEARATALEAARMARVTMAPSPTPATPVPSGAYTLAPFAAPAAGDDPLGFWASAQPTRLTCPTGQGGLFLVSGTAGYAPGAGGHVVEIRKNGVVIPGTASSGAGLASINHVLPTSLATVRLVPTDYITLALWTDTSTNTAVTAGQTSALQLVRIGN